MRRLFVVILIAFFGAPSVAAAQSPSLLNKPLVIVYPFTPTASTIDHEASARLATLIATEMANTGKVDVVPPVPGTERADFLARARAAHADFYITGFMSPLGDGVSLVEQVVSTTSGIVVYSNSAQLTTYADATGQGDDLALFASRYANRALSSLGTPPPAGSPTPQPSAAAQANIGKLFGHRKSAAQASPSPAPSTAAAPITVATVVPAIPRGTVAGPVEPTVAPASPPPAPAAQPAPRPTTAVVAHVESLAVLPIGGAADAALRAAATDRLVERAHAERAESSAAACGAHPHDAVLSGSLTVHSAPAVGSSASLELTATSCAGKMLWIRSFTSDTGGSVSAQTATDSAVDAAAAYLNGPGRT